MKVKETLFIICVLVCMILAISSINAADSDINVIASANGSSEVISTDIQYDENLNSIENEEIIGDDDGSFSALNDLISGASENDVIELTHDYVWSDSDVVTNGTVISKTLTINGNNHVIDAKGNDRIFRITGTNVVLKNIIFINGKATKQNIGQGGAIWWDGANGIVDNCTFKENTVVSDTYNRGSAGAIWWVGAKGTLTDSTFIKNSGDGLNEAGAVYWDSLNGLIQNTKFIDNYHSNLGGALYIGENGDYSNIKGCTFINNTAGRYGGAIGLHTGNYVKISNSLFINNSAEYAGGGIYYNYPVGGNNQFDVDNCTFIGNIANGNDQLASNSGGGAIYTSMKGNITKSTFIDNKAPYGSNGAISWQSGTGEITRSLFINNTASSGKYSTIDLDDGKIEDSIILTNTNEFAVLLNTATADYNWWGNTADNYNVKSNKVAGIINNWFYLDVLPNNLKGWAYVTLYNFYDSQTKETYDYDGYCYLPNITFELTAQNMVIDTNKVTLVNGEDYYFFEDITYPATITVKNGNVEYTKTITLGDFDLLQMLINEAEPDSIIVLQRDYIYTEGLDSIDHGININKNLVIDGNGHTIDAKGKSRIFNINSGSTDLSFKNINFINGYDYYGGAILIDSYYGGRINNLKIDNCIFKNNIAYTSTYGYGGGAIFIYGSGNNINFNLTNSKFFENCANRGGAIYFENQYVSLDNKLLIYNSTFDGNIANYYASLYIAVTNKTITLIDCCIFVNNAKSTCIIGISNSGMINNSILLNNGNLDSYIFAGNSLIVNNNWWGSTADNYTVDLSTSKFIDGATINNWLLLNATVNPSTPVQGEDASIRFLLQSYNFITGEVSEYDNNNIPQIPLFLGFINGGYADEYDVLLNDDFDFHVSPISIGGFVEASCQGVSYRFNFDIKKSCEITVTKDTYELGAGVPNEYLILSDLASLSRAGDLKYEINDTSVGYIVDGKLKTLKSGIIKLTISADEDEEYGSASAEIIIIVNKIDPIILYNSKTDSVDVDSSKNLNCSLKQLYGYLPYDYELTYESANNNVVTVDENGVITGIVGGTANIIVSYPGDEKYNSKKFYITVTVNKLPNKLESNPSVILEAGQTGLLDVNQDASTTLTFTSDDESIISVDENGKITAIKGGITKITITSSENDKYLSNTTTVTVTVKKQQSEMSDEKVELTVDDNYNIGDLIVVTGLKFNSNDTTVASVDANGIITAIGGGVANITIQFDGNDTHDGFNASIIVTVNKLPTTITVDSDEISTRVDNTVNLYPKLSHEGNLVYEIENPSIVSVDENGVITGLLGGNTIITIRYVETSRYQGANEQVTVKVNRIPSTIRVNETFNLRPGESVNLEATLNNGGIITYESSNSSIVIVDEFGNITSLKEGDVNITVLFKGDGRNRETKEIVKVTVRKLPVEINAEDIKLLINETKTIDATLSPISGKLTYVVGNSSIISINDDGLIAPLASGKTNITIIFEGDETYASLNKTIFVTVNKLDVNIISPEYITLKIGETWDLSQYIHDDVNVVYHFNDGYDLVQIDENGIATAISGKDPGFANVLILFAGNEKYNSKTQSLKIYVEKLKYEFNIGDNTIEMAFNEEINLKEKFNLDFDINSESFDSSIVSAEGNMIKANAIGETTVMIEFAGNDTHNKNSTYLNIIVKKAPSIIDVDESISLNVGDVKNLNAILNHEGSLAYSNDNSDIISIDENGNIKAIAYGSATITITIDENDQYLSGSTKVTVTVNKLPIPNSDNAIDLNNPEDTDSPTYSINLPADATGTLTVEVDGKTYTADVVNGTASITVPGLSAGEHDVSVTYSGDSKYPSISKKTSIYVPEIKITKNKDINMLYTSGGKYSVQVTKDSQALAGVTVTFTVNGKQISAKTDSRGYASVKINLPPRAKAYEVTAEYKGVKVTNKVKVTSIIKAKNIKSKKTKKVLKIKISLKKVNKKYLKGKKVTLKFKGKTYKAKTNKKGVATFKIKNNVLKKLKVGKKYKYKVTYLKNTVTKKITIKR